MYAQGDEINHTLLFELHAWTCWLCKKPINKNLPRHHRMSATVEHIVPICLGGTHTWDNVAPAHALCNFKKANLPFDDMPDTMTI